MLLIFLLSFSVQVCLAIIPEHAIDTLINDDSIKANAIKKLVASQQIPQKETVQLVSDYTQYGFKNLFSNKRYDGSMPYNNQINPQAELFIQDYMRSHATYLKNMNEWGRPYFNLMEQILMQYGLPKELKYIAVIESNLSMHVTSNKGARGPWQFMPETARRQGLTVNDYIDDRMDYVKSTHAAARFMLSLFEVYHDWLLVMAAYNGGPGRVNGAIQKSGSRDFWKLQYHLPEESRVYVKRFIATHYIMEGSGGATTNRINQSYESIHLKDTLEVALEKLTINGKYNSLVIAKNLSMDIRKFNLYNPDFDGGIATIGSYELRLPEDKMKMFVSSKSMILQECIQLILSGVNIPNKTNDNRLGH